MLYKNQKLEPRGENEPKFNMKNKTDRKIFFTMLTLIIGALVVLTGLILLYVFFFRS